MEYCYVNPDSQKLIYTDFVRDLREDKGYKFLYYPNEYAGEEIVKLCCTQHSDVDHENLLDRMSDYQRKKITNSWVEFLSTEQLPLKEVQLCTKTPQNVLDALCCQTSKVEVFSICTYQTRNDIMIMEDDRFIVGMKGLRYLYLRDVRILNQTYLSAEAVSDLEYACFRRV